ncbi:EPIDERMAL PATTERNING FACTOR-like protein 8 [Rutidosis leptorrhynchoides]|uniref:EPIDERMAL PATTERNING FACTOR-like protein 8 n=1 Tax=Rutidosis leptorrhynchoides TaxID=125765 RepID=UPI003A993688
MAPARTCSLYIRMIITVFILFSLTLSDSISVNEQVTRVKQSKKILGSRPPGCVNKCSNCNPCRATLVIPPHHKTMDRYQSSHGDEDCYYLLSWKCKCGDKLFQP